jgi:ankyrin repeat protein
MDSFFKIAAVDIDARCNNITPFKYSDMNRQQDAKTGRVFTNDDVKQAWATFMKITNSTKSRAIPCCNPNIQLSDVNPEIFAVFQEKYPYARPIVRNGDLVELQLTKNAKAQEAGWEPITPYIVCKLSYALTNPGFIKKSADADDVWIVSREGMLLDCFPANCPDSSTVDNLFGTARKDPEYTYIDDASVARAVADGDVKFVRDYIFKFNNADQILTHDDYRNRLVHLAAMNYRPKVFQLLVSVKADFNVRNAQGNTPIHLAVQSGNMDCIEELLKLSGQTIEVNVKNTAGQTPLMMAIAYKPKPDPKTGQIPKTELQLPMTMIRYLYNHGASVLDRDALGNNMIHNILLNMPVESDKVTAVKFMLSKGVSADQKNNAGITPLMLAAELIKASGADNLLPPAEIIDTLPENEDTNSMVFEGFWADQTLLPSETIASVNQHLASGNGAGGFNIINAPQLPPADNQGVSEIDPARLSKEQLDLMEIRTMLFNDIIRNNPTKYNKFISVRDIPAGAPVEILDHNCVSATGELISDRIDTAEQCSQQPGGNWVPVKNPSTLVKLELLPESKRIIDAVPDDKLYYPKARPSQDAVPLPAAIQELNATVRAQTSGSANNNTKTTARIANESANNQSANNQSANNQSAIEGFHTEGFYPEGFHTEGFYPEGFHPVLAPLLTGAGHHISAAAGFIGAHAGGFLADLTGQYISKSIVEDPPIDPDNLSSQRRPVAININAIPSIPSTATNTNNISNNKKNNTTHEHPPVMSPVSAGNNTEGFQVNHLDIGRTATRKGIRYFLEDNWTMLIVFLILAVILVFYVSRVAARKK